MLLFGCLQEYQAQGNSGYRIIRSSLGSSGSSQNVITSNGTYKVSQSIGQASVIGTHYSNGYYLRQGYQQPLTTIKVSKETSYNLEAKVYPNPFKDTVTIAFNSLMSNNISIMMFDLKGRLIHSQEYQPAQVINLKIGDISTGTYFLKVISGKNYLNSKLIKI